LEKSAFVDDTDAVGQVGDLREDVTGHEHGDPGLVDQPQQQPADLDDARGIEPVGRFVENEEIWPVQEGARQREPLLVAERELSRPTVG